MPRLAPGRARLLLRNLRCDLPELLQSQTDRTACARVLARHLPHGEPHVEFGGEGAVLALGPGLAEVGGKALAALLALDLPLHQVDGGIERAQGARLGVGALLGIRFAGDGVHAVGERTDDGKCGIELHGGLIGCRLVSGGLPPPRISKTARAASRLTCPKMGACERPVLRFASRRMRRASRCMPRNPRSRSASGSRPTRRSGGSLTMRATPSWASSSSRSRKKISARP